ncbi:MAG: hypothetical protein J2P25_14210 [Nocardiopsaceae bacterium]|nr:hypothetical protein [Nocardiopsaceae bacterium]
MRAATYLDREFRDRALRDVYNARNKRVAPSHGFDIVPVLRHAWRAWWLETGQYLLTLAVLAAGLAAVPLDTVITLDVLVIWYLLRLWLRWARQFVGYGEPVDSPALDQLNLVRDRRMRLNGKMVKYSLWSSLTVLFLLMLASAVSSRAESVTSWLAGTGSGVAAIAVAFSCVVACGATARMLCLAHSQSAAPRSRRLSRRMKAIDEQQDHPIVVHTGHKPFVGSGKSVRSWSFAQRLVEADRTINGKVREFDKPPFPARKLIDSLKSSILDLGEDENAETRLPGLSVTDWVFVHETHAESSLSDALASDAGDDVNRAIADAIAKPGDAARHYLAARVESWGGDIVTSVFAHASLQGRTLYLEFATYALFPVKTDYAASRMGARAIAAHVGTALMCLPERLMESWRLVQAPALLMPAPSRAYTGTDISLREIVMLDSDVKFRDEPESSYFQVQDIAQHSKIIERRLIATVEDFLDDAGVDTSEFVQRTTEILNSGVLNIGSGNVSVANSAVGENSSVVM